MYAQTFMGYGLSEKGLGMGMGIVMGMVTGQTNNFAMSSSLPVVLTIPPMQDYKLVDSPRSLRLLLRPKTMRRVSMMHRESKILISRDNAFSP